MKVERKSDAFVNGALAVATLFISGLLIWALSQQSNWYEREATDRSYHYARNAEEQITTYCSFFAPDPVKCAEETAQTAREYQRKEQDLAAQKVTAWWTAIMGGAAVFGVILSAFGIFLVYRTFNATREANKIARDTAKRQLRAYLSLRKVMIEELNNGPDPIKVLFPLENSGATPATKVRVFWAWQCTAEKPSSELYDEIVGNAEEPEGGIDHSIGPHQLKKVRHEIDIADEWKERIRSGELEFYLLGMIKYRDTFDDPHVTEFFYRYTASLPNRLKQAGVRNNIG